MVDADYRKQVLGFLQRPPELEQRVGDRPGLYSHSPSRVTAGPRGDVAADGKCHVCGVHGAAGRGGLSDEIRDANSDVGFEQLPRGFRHRRGGPRIGTGRGD